MLLPILPCTCREEEACEQNDPIRGGGTQIEILKMKVDWNMRRNEKGCDYGTREIEENLFNRLSAGSIFCVISS